MYSVTHSYSEWIFWFNRKWNCSAQLNHERFLVTPDLKVNIILNLTYMKAWSAWKVTVFGPNAMPGGSGQMRHLAFLVLRVFEKYLLHLILRYNIYWKYAWYYQLHYEFYSRGHCYGEL